MMRKLSVILVLAFLVNLYSVPVTGTGASEYTSLSTKDIILEIMESDIAISLLATNTTYEEAYSHL